MKKAVATAGFSMVGVSGLASARGPNDTYVGVAYNPRTGEVRSDATANLMHDDETVQGLLDIGRSRIPINVGNPTVKTDEVRSYVAEKHGRFARNGSPTRVKIISSPTSRWVTGIVTPPRQGTPRLNGTTPRTAFTLVPASSDVTREELVADLKRGGL